MIGLDTIEKEWRVLSRAPRLVAAIFAVTAATTFWFVSYIKNEHIETLNTRVAAADSINIQLRALASTGNPALRERALRIADQASSLLEKAQSGHGKPILIRATATITNGVPATSQERIQCERVRVAAKIAREDMLPRLPGSYHDSQASLAYDSDDCFGGLAIAINDLKRLAMSLSP